MQARLLPATRGVFWIAAGFHLYRRNPPLLSMLTFANMLLALVFSQMPPVGPFLLLLVSPLVMALIANGCAAIGDFGPLQLSPLALLKGLRERVPLLVRLGAVQMFYVLAVVIVFDRLLPEIDADLLLGARGEAGDAARVAARLDPAQLGLLLLHLGAIAVAVLPSFWFAPLLTAWHGVPPLKAVFFSFVAVWRNWRAFLVYVTALALIVAVMPALVLSLLVLISATLGGIFASVVQILLLLVFAPVLMTGAYCGYRDIFAPSAAPPDAANPAGAASDE